MNQPDPCCPAFAHHTEPKIERIGYWWGKTVEHGAEGWRWHMPTGKGLVPVHCCPHCGAPLIPYTVLAEAAD